MINPKKPMFLITYGDIQIDNELKISDKVVEVLENKGFQRYMISVAGAIVALVTSTSAKAMSPEVGEAAVNAINDALKPGGEAIPGIGEINGMVNQRAAALPVDKLNPANFNPQIPPVGNMPVNMPSNPPVLAGKGLQLPAKPISQSGQILATTSFIGALTIICLQAGFNPVAAFMCASGVVGTGVYLAKSVRVLLLLKLY